ncbi:nicotinamide mononucleotide adenylyl transferase [Tothia fuscella]|uniref:Nicotinamide-nucleotide adenylyltransferase n=1 Tax=Tothia fuscella TaxID=1048955 RepID=A0A9P4NDT3_9PEZI|nr:nicotinamide mononucleotide adenylyl transferase [Tothia fuscella]
MDINNTAPAARGLVSSEELRNYSLETSALTTKLSQDDRGKIPLAVIACGSFSPPTYLHLRMFEMAKDWARKDGKYAVVGAYISPVGDAYKKKGLAPAVHRVRMCELATSTMDAKSKFIMVDPWEALQSSYQPTAQVLDHFNYELNTKLGGIEDCDGKRIRIQIMLLGGADLLETFTQPGVWSVVDLNHILCDFGAVIIERQGTDLEGSIEKLEPSWRKHVHVINQHIRNDVSSTKIRDFLSTEQSIKYLVPELVIQYIDEQGLYRTVAGVGNNTGPAPAPPVDQS